MKNLYLERYAYPSLELDIQPPEQLKLVVTIPSYKEPFLIDALKSLALCIPPKGNVIVLVLINQPEDCLPEDERINRESYREALEWAEKNSSEKISFEIIWKKGLPVQHAGVGLARKIAMDEAVRIFERPSERIPDIHYQGIIVCFDADCQCDRNFLVELEDYYAENKNCPAAVTYYEHPLDGSLDQKVYDGIAQYELFLRYHVNALRFAGFPYAYQTVGSCMSVRSSVYQKQGGMNKRKAGEDFYFLQKLFPLPGFGEINTTRVMPSPRHSDRVPFGTGKTIGSFISSSGRQLAAYNPQSYQDIRSLIAMEEDFYGCDTVGENMLMALPESMMLFLRNNQFLSALAEMKESSPVNKTFHKKFFHWLNGFRLLKFLHFARDNFYPSVNIEDAASWLLKEYFGIQAKSCAAKDLLMEFRTIDRGRGKTEDRGPGTGDRKPRNH